MRIWVSKKDIELGTNNQCNGKSCPIALAVKRKFGKLKKVHVSVNYTQIDDQIYNNNEKTIEKINRFDVSGVITPGYIILKEWK